MMDVWARLIRLGYRVRLPWLVLYLGLAGGVNARTWINPTRKAVGEGPDPLQFPWFLNWAEFALAHHRNPMLTTYLNYPEGVNLMWSASMLLPGALLSPVTALLGPIFSYNLWMTLSIGLSAWTAMLVIRRWAPSTLGAAGGGLLYGFSPYMMAHSVGGHPNLVFALYPPLVLLLLDEILVQTRWSALVSGLMFGILTAAQLLISEEIVASTALAAAIALGWLVLLHGDRFRSRVAHATRALTTAAVVALVLSAVPLAVQFFGPLRAPADIHYHNLYVNDFLNFVVPTRVEKLVPAAALRISSHYTGNDFESNAYLGLPLLLVLGFAAVRWWRLPIVRVATLSGVTLAILSLGPYLHVGGHDTRIPMPYQVFDKGPIIRNLLPARLALYVDLCAALLLAVFLDRAARSPSRPLVVVALGVAVCALIPLVSPRVPSVPAETPSFFSTSLPRHLPEGSVILVAPSYGCPPAVLPMLWQIQSGMHFRILGGYFVGPNGACSMALGSPSSPLSSVVGAISDGKRAPALDPALRQAIVADLSHRRVSAVVVGPMPKQDVMLKVFTNLYGYAPHQDGGVYVWWTVPVAP